MHLNTVHTPQALTTDWGQCHCTPLKLWSWGITTVTMLLLGRSPYSCDIPPELSLLMLINEGRNQLHLFAGREWSFNWTFGKWLNVCLSHWHTAFNNNIDIGWYFMVIIDVINICCTRKWNTMMGTTTGKSCMSRTSSVPSAYYGADSYNHNR